MQIISFRAPGSDGAFTAGFSDGTSVVTSSDLGYPATVRELFAAHAQDLRPVLDRAAAAIGAGEGIAKVTDVHVGPGVPDPDKILCMGLNYAEHAKESKMEVSDFPPIFAKFRNSLIGPYDSIVMPGVSTDIDYEAELAVVIGTRCKAVSAEDALDYVGGYAVFNDVSARDIQFRTHQWGPGKMLDTFGPLSGITPRIDVPDAQALRISARVNGQTLQDSNTSELIFGIAETVSYLSGIATLEPGDIIVTGTPSGVGVARDPQLWLKAGDLVEIEIESLGILSNPVVEPVVG